LTPSRKKQARPSRSKRRPPLKSKTDRLDILDKLHGRCERVEMVAELLKACDAPHSLDAGLAARAGYFIAEELDRVRELAAKLGKEAR